MASVSCAPVKLINAASEIQQTPVRDAGEIGYTAHLMIQACLPHSDPKTYHYVRTNGKTRLSLVDVHKIGLPFGVIPRLLLAYVTTEATLTKSPTIELGDSLTGFLGVLGMDPTGGQWGTITRVRKQADRLFNCVIGIRHDNLNDSRVSSHNMLIATDIDLWWKPNTDSKATPDFDSDPH